MKYLKRFNEEQICEQIINHIELSINEGFDLKSVWDRTVSKIKNLSHDSKKKILTHLIGSLLTISAATQVYNTIQRSNMSQDDISLATEILDEKKEDKFKLGFEFNISEEGVEHIKDQEKLRLTAYKIGDGMTTIGWGHAEKSTRSNYRVGQKISQEEADSLLKSDLNTIESGIKRIFKDWKKKGIDVKIDQSMYDALVSIGYNTGINGLRKSETMRHLKKKDYVKAGESIKTLKVSKKFPGLALRREKEAEMFLSGII